VTLQPGESKVVAFEATPTKARTYQVSVNGLEGSFTAKELALMATRYEYYNTSDDGWTFAFGIYWVAQTFTPSVSHDILFVKLKLFRTGSPGTVTVSIRATDGSGHPTGGDLCSGTIDGNSLTTSYAGEWREITLGGGACLTAEIQYAIVIRALTGSAGNAPGWRQDGSSPTYDGGIYEISSNSGTSWTGISVNDKMFEEWGVPPVETYIKTGAFMPNPDDLLFQLASTLTRDKAP